MADHRRLYVECDCCGKPIYLGDPIYYMDGRCGTYCSKECYADTYADCGRLTLNHAENCSCDLYEDREIPVTTYKHETKAITLEEAKKVWTDSKIGENLDE